MGGQSFWSPRVRELVPYVPGEQPRIPNLVKLNTNENPYPPSPRAIAAIAQAARSGLQLYPDPESTAAARGDRELPRPGRGPGLPRQWFRRSPGPRVLRVLPAGPAVAAAGRDLQLLPCVLPPLRDPGAAGAGGRSLADRRGELRGATGGRCRDRQPECAHRQCPAFGRDRAAAAKPARLRGAGGRSLRRFRRRQRHRAHRPLPEPSGGAHLVQIALAGGPEGGFRGGAAASHRGAGAGEEQLQLLSARPAGRGRRGRGLRGRRPFRADARRPSSRAARR